MKTQLIVKKAKTLFSQMAVAANDPSIRENLAKDVTKLLRDNHNPTLPSVVRLAERARRSELVPEEVTATILRHPANRG